MINCPGWPQTWALLPLPSPWLGLQAWSRPGSPRNAPSGPPAWFLTAPARYRRVRPTRNSPGSETRLCVTRQRPPRPEEGWHGKPPRRRRLTGPRGPCRAPDAAQLHVRVPPAPASPPPGRPRTPTRTPSRSLRPGIRPPSAPPGACGSRRVTRRQPTSPSLRQGEDSPEHRLPPGIQQRLTSCGSSPQP